MTTNNDSRPVGATPVRATAVAGAVLFTDMLLEGLAIPVLPLLPAVVEQGEAATGILFSSYAAAMIVATLFTGRVVDRRGPKGPLLTELIVLVAATLLFATGGPYWLLLVARFVQGIAGGIAWVAALSLIAAATGIEKRGQMMGIAMSTVTLGVLAGPPLGGFLVDAFGPASPFLIAAAVAIVDIALLRALIPGSPRQSDDTAGPLTVLRVRGSASIVAAIGVGAAVLAAVQPVLPGRIGEQSSASTIIGVLFGIAALVGIIANPIVGHVMTSTTPRLLVGAGIVAVAAALLVIGWSSELWQIGIGGASRPVLGDAARPGHHADQRAGISIGAANPRGFVRAVQPRLCCWPDHRSAADGVRCATDRVHHRDGDHRPGVRGSRWRRSRSPARRAGEDH